MSFVSLSVGRVNLCWQHSTGQLFLVSGSIFFLPQLVTTQCLQSRAEQSRSLLPAISRHGHSWHRALVGPVAIYLLLAWQLRFFFFFWGALSDERTGLTFIYICCWPLPAQSFFGPSPLGLATIFYCLTFETSLFVASYDSQECRAGGRWNCDWVKQRSLVLFNSIWPCSYNEKQWWKIFWKLCGPLKMW
jgi:hypothetical protein